MGTNIPATQSGSVEGDALINDLKSFEAPLERLTRPELLEAIKVAVANLENRKKQDGWTTWLLMVAIGSLIWACLRYLELPVFWSQVLAAFVFSSLVLKIQYPIMQILQPEERTFRKGTRCHSLDLLAGVRTEIAASALQNATLCIAAVVLGRSWSIGFVLAIYFGWNCVTEVVGICSASWDYEIPKPFSTGRTFQDWLSLLWIVSMIVAVGLFVMDTGLDFTSLRVGFLLTAVFQCIYWLGKHVTPPPFLQPLLQIQQDFAFGRITHEEAHRLADITLAGQHFEDVLRRRVLPIITALDDLKVQTAQFHHCVEKWETEYKGMDEDAASSPAKIERLKNQGRLCLEAKRGLSEAKKDFEQRHLKLLARIAIYRIGQSATKAQLGLLVSSIESSKKAMLQQMEDSQTRCAETVESWMEKNGASESLPIAPTGLFKRIVARVFTGRKNATTAATG